VHVVGLEEWWLMLTVKQKPRKHGAGDAKTGPTVVKTKGLLHPYTETGKQPVILRVVSLVVCLVYGIRKIVAYAVTPADIKTRSRLSRTDDLQVQLSRTGRRNLCRPI